MGNNSVFLKGTIASQLIYSHSEGDVLRYGVFVLVSDSNADMIFVVIPESMKECMKDVENTKVNVSGQLISNINAVAKMYVQAQTIEFTDDEYTSSCNEIVLDGYVCGYPIIRKGFLGCKICFVVNNSTNFIPCLYRSRSASDTINIGSNVRIKGRLVSKVIELGCSTQISYEVCVDLLEIE